MMAGIDSPAFFIHEDGAKMAYEILGNDYLGRKTPVILIGGMSSLRGDWDRLAKALAMERPVLIFDHRGMGDSTFSPGNIDDITIESYARDLLALLTYLRWKEIALCGFSMGGVIAQQLLLLPCMGISPTPLPFRVTHVVLAGTLSPPLLEKEAGLMINVQIPTKPRTKEEKKEIARPTLESTFDPQWINNPDNSERLNWWLDRMIHGRPTRTIIMQARALKRCRFQGLHARLSKETQFLVIHGELDEIVPFRYGQELLQLIPWGRTLQVGKDPGQVENLAFGHHWFEYFDVGVWCDVFRLFLEPPGRCPVARL